MVKKSSKTFSDLVNSGDYISITDAAQKIGCQPNTIRNWCNKGRLKSYLCKSGGDKYFIKTSDFNAVMKNMDVKMEEYYTVREAADKIGVHSQTIRNWYHSGILTPCVSNFTRGVYIKKSELDNVMERVNGQEAKPQ